MEYTSLRTLEEIFKIMNDKRHVTFDHVLTRFNFYQQHTNTVLALGKLVTNTTINYLRQSTIENELIGYLRQSKMA